MTKNSMSDENEGLRNDEECGPDEEWNRGGVEQK